jgi:hypothetical protein
MLSTLTMVATHAVAQLKQPQLSSARRRRCLFNVYHFQMIKWLFQSMQQGTDKGFFRPYINSDASRDPDPTCALLHIVFSSYSEHGLVSVTVEFEPGVDSLRALLDSVRGFMREDYIVLGGEPSYDSVPLMYNTQSWNSPVTYQQFLEHERAYLQRRWATHATEERTRAQNSFWRRVILRLFCSGLEHDSDGDDDDGNWRAQCEMEWNRKKSSWDLDEARARPHKQWTIERQVCIHNVLPPPSFQQESAPKEEEEEPRRSLTQFLVYSVGNKQQQQQVEENIEEKKEEKGEEDRCRTYHSVEELEALVKAHVVPGSRWVIDWTEHQM